MPVTEHICPHCSTPTTNIHDYYLRTIKDVPVQKKIVTIHYNQRRYKCPSCNKSFNENNCIVSRYSHHTTNLNGYIVNSLRSRVSIFTHAKIIADRFHFVRYAVGAVDTLRKKVQSNLQKSERKWFKKSRRLLLSRRCKIKKDEDFEQLNYMLINFSEDLRIAYREKEAFLDIVHSTEPYDVKEKLFNEWVCRNLSSPVEELGSVAKTYQHWAVEIRHALEFPYSNGCTEGVNNKIKNCGGFHFLVLKIIK